MRKVVKSRAGLRVKPALLIHQPAGYKVFFVNISDTHNPQTNKFVTVPAPINFAPTGPADYIFILKNIFFFFAKYNINIIFIIQILNILKYFDYYF